MKTLTIAIAVLILGMSLIGCDNAPVMCDKPQTDAVNNLNYDVITVVDMNNNVASYEFKNVYYGENLLNIEFPEGCGVSYLFENVKSFKIEK